MAQWSLYRVLLSQSCIPVLDLGVCGRKPTLALGRRRAIGMGWNWGVVGMKGVMGVQVRLREGWLVFERCVFDWEGSHDVVFPDDRSVIEDVFGYMIFERRRCSTLLTTINWVSTSPICVMSK